MKTNKMQQMGRRRFLNTLSGLGLSGAALANMSKESLAKVTDDPSEEVPRLGELRHTNHDAIANQNAPPEREPIYYTIPRDKWVRVEATQQAMHELERRLVSQLGSPLVRPSVGMITTGHRSQRGIIVEYRSMKKPDGSVVSPNPPFEAVREALPETVTGSIGTDNDNAKYEGIPVRIERREIQKQAYFDYKYRAVPSGAQIQAYRDHDDDGTVYVNTGTTCARAYDNNVDEYVMITAGHNFYDENNDVQTGGSVWQPGFDVYNDLEIGTGYEAEVTLDTSGDGIREFDAGTIQMNKDTTNKFAADRGDNTYQNERVGGIIGWDTIKDHVGDSDYKLRLQGKTTGENSGKIRRLFSNRNYGIEVNSQKGDSGGPHFKATNYIDGTYYNSIAGVHHSGTKDSSKWAFATHIGEVEDRFNLNV